MPLMTWDPSLDVGVDAMNAEHRDILAAMNAIFDAHQAGKRGDEINTAVAKLGAVCTRHFADEEAFMEKMNFPGLRTHKLIHQELLTEFGKHAAAIKAANGEVPDEFFSFLKRWLAAHIKGIDTKYGAYAKDHTSSAA